MSKARKLRRLKIDVTQFLADYRDAVESNMPVQEFCEVTGISISTLHGRLISLAKRGVVLPLLLGMKKRTKLGRILGVCVTPPTFDPPAAPEPHAAPEATVIPTFQICIGTGF